MSTLDPPRRATWPTLSVCLSLPLQLWRALVQLPVVAERGRRFAGLRVHEYNCLLVSRVLRAVARMPLRRATATYNIAHPFPSSGATATTAQMA